MTGVRINDNEVSKMVLITVLWLKELPRFRAADYDAANWWYLALRCCDFLYR